VSNKAVTYETMVRRLKTTIRQLFMEEKNRRMAPRKYKPDPTRHDRGEFWERAAKQCLSLQADPDTYIKAAFEFCKQREGPFPNAIGGNAHIFWYKSKLESLGMEMPAPLPEGQMAPEREEPKPLAPGEEPVDEVQYPAEVDLALDIEQAQALFFHTSGSLDPHNAQNLAMMRNPRNSLQCTAICLLGGYDSEVLMTFGKRIYDFFTSNPSFLAAARRRGFPIDETLQWIQNHVLLKT